MNGFDKRTAGSAAAAAAAAVAAVAAMQNDNSTCTPSCTTATDQQPTKNCRHCYSPNLVLDWSQGDRICTTCGVVDEQHVRYDGPEWRDFTEDDGGAAGAAATPHSASARAGLVPTDETRWLGGLQPTTLSRHPCGGAYGAGSGDVAAAESRIRRRLLSTNRKLDSMMEAKHKEQMEEARLARRVMARRRREAQHAMRAAVVEEAEALGSAVGGGALSQLTSSSSSASAVTSSKKGQRSHVANLPFALDDDLASIGREHLELAQKEEDAAHLDSAIILANKYSLDRAVLLYGTHDEQRYDNSFHPMIGSQTRDIEEEREQLNKKLDSVQRSAAADTYRASRILLHAARTLDLPDRAIDEATAMLCKYAAVKNGFRVRGVSSQSKAATSMEQLTKQRNRNKERQMASLGSAFIYLSAKKLGQGRSLKDVCASFRREHTPKNEEEAGDNDIIKAKHCSRAMTEIKVLFPEYVKSVACPTAASQTRSTGNAASNGETSLSLSAAGLGSVFSHRNETEVNTLVDSAGHKLNLSPSAITAIQRLAVHCLKEQMKLGNGSGTKPTTLCAALTYLVCLAGSSMQNLARQALAPSEGSQTKRKHVRAREVSRSAKKKQKREVVELAECTMKIETEESCSVARTAVDEKATPIKNEKVAEFDVMSHAPVKMKEEVMSKSEQETIEVWDAWYSQKSWSREVGAIAEAYSASQGVTVDYYKKHVHYRRKQLLQLLQADSLSDLRETTLLLKRIAAAAMIMSAKI
mmetsp:Transcript_25652/g.56161  ORF Transcript_25652/g.56161 Transcript_25652/m.56161 type:complete len:753 (-) Transcript_25652:2180-4438(-)